jgi:hypothetical protein
MTRLGRAAAWFMVLAPLSSTIVAGCKVVHGSTTSGHATGSGVGGAGGSGDSGTGAGGPTGREIFESTVQAQILKECNSCHMLGGISEAPFLATPDIYGSISGWPGVVVPNPMASILMTHPGSLSHGGGMAPSMSPTLEPLVLTWLQFEAAHIPMPIGSVGPSLPTFKPFLHGAFNAVYLDPLGTDLANTSVTFNAQEYGNPPSLLVLSNIEVHPISGISVHIVHPLFTVYAQGGGATPDVVDSFSGFDTTYTIDSDPTFGTGTVVLDNWAKDARLGLAFEKVEVATVGGGVGSCHDPTTFQMDVVPQLHMWGCADKCHGGGNIQAQQQMDLSNVDAIPPDDACSQVRARIKPGDPTQSEILIVTDPNKPAVHLFKFAGNLNNYNTFKTAVTPWIMAEQ